MVKKTPKTLKLVVDAGNGNTKVSVAGETEVIPSLLSANYGSYIRGGFRLSNEDWILGWDCINRADRIIIAEKETGKLDYLHLMLSGAISAMAHIIPPNASLELHLLTLNADKRQYIQDKVTQVQDTGLSIDETLYPISLTLKNIYPEGYGASLYASDYFQGHKRVAVLDIGNGTLNLSQYYTANGFPRRESFAYVGAGVQNFLQLTNDLLTQQTSNGRVDESLLAQAIQSNTYRYLSTYEGLHIWDTCVKASSVWLEQVKVKQLLIQVKALLSSGVPVVLAGGGACISCIREPIYQALQNHELLHTPDQPGIIGVAGLANKLEAN